MPFKNAALLQVRAYWRAQWPILLSGVFRDHCSISAERKLSGEDFEEASTYTFSVLPESETTCVHTNFVFRLEIRAEVFEV